MAVTFIILSTQRTGSSWLLDLLAKLEGCECHGELLLPEPVETEPIAGSSDYRRYIEVRYSHWLGVRPLSLFSYLNDLYERKGSIGFNVMYSQLRKHPEILVYLSTKWIRVVHLVRENLLDTVISSKLAAKSGRSHDAVDGESTEDSRVHLDPIETIEYIRRLERKVDLMARILGAGRLRRTLCLYEDLVRNPETFRCLAEFLLLPGYREMPKSSLVKRQRRPHEESIRNYGEIEKVLTKNGYARFLGDAV
jgi:LPS sulfotransferase NodH